MGFEFRPDSEPGLIQIQPYQYNSVLYHRTVPVQRTVASVASKQPLFLFIFWSVEREQPLFLFIFWSRERDQPLFLPD